VLWHPINASVRALERSGTVAFVCLGAPGEGSARPLDDCDESLFDRVDDFGEEGRSPHLYALVTQETRGEVALVDLSTGSDSLLDQDPSTPGDSFLPVGARPVSILATPGGTAAFVACCRARAPCALRVADREDPPLRGRRQPLRRSLLRRSPRGQPASCLQRRERWCSPTIRPLPKA
jgi:hypothetical protein